MKEIENLPLTQELAKVRVQENDANYQKALAQQALDRKQAEFTVNTTIETRIALLRSELSIQEAITSQARARGEVTQEQYTGRLGSSGITPNQISNGTAGSTAGGNSAVSGSSVLGQLTAGVPGGSVLDQLTGSAKGVPGAGPSMFDPKFAAMVYEMVNGQVTKVPYEQARREYYSTGDPNRNFIFFPASPLNPATMSAQQTETQRLATYLGPGGANKVTLTPQEVKDLAGYAQPPQKQALNVTVTLNGSDIGKAAADEIYDGLNLQVGTAP
jgi:hypothetical protein